MSDNKLDFLELTNDTFGLAKINPDEAAPLVLAYIGDAVYEVIVRTIIISKGNRPVEKIHKDTISFVNAGTQARLIEALIDELTDTEASVYRRGKNAKSNTSAKNASLKDYHKATGFEALIGYLYLKGQNERAMELLEKGFGLLDLTTK